MGDVTAATNTWGCLIECKKEWHVKADEYILTTTLFSYFTNLPCVLFDLTFVEYINMVHPTYPQKTHISVGRVR